MNVVIYARYSSHSQTEQSIEGQIATCKEYAKRNNYTIVGEYIDRALSGTNDNRPEFKRMIEDSNKKYFNGVLVYQLDRFARNRYDSATYKNKLKKNNVKVFSAKENISDDASGVLMESLLEGMAEYYSVELSQKVTRGMRINAEKCLYNGGIPPLGYKIEDKKYQIDENTAPIVEKIFNMYADGYIMADIIKYLNDRNLKTSYDKEFNKNSIRRILSNEKYIGKYKFQDIEVENGVPQIIDNETFEKVQEMLSRNKKARARAKAKTEYLLTTKLFCGHCKEMMVGVSGTSKTGKTHNYYSCNGTRKKICKKKNVQKDFIENLVAEEAQKLLTDDNIEKISNEVVKLVNEANRSDNIKNLEKTLKEKEKQKINLLDSLKICEIEIVRKSIFEEIQKVEEERKSIENSILIEKAQNIEITIPQIRFFLTELRKGNVEDIKYKKLLINVLINEIYLYDDNMIIIFNTQDKENKVEIPNIDEIQGSFIGASGAPSSRNYLRTYFFNIRYGEKMEQNIEDKLLIAKLQDKIKCCKNRNKIVNTEFLNLHQKRLIQNKLNELKITNYIFHGGFEEAENKVLILYPQKLTEEIVLNSINEIINVIKITLPNEQVGQYEHRDYLSSVMKLGLGRERIGDIIVYDHEAYIIVLKQNAEYIKNSLKEFTRFKKSQIEIIDVEEIKSKTPELMPLEIHVSSNRLDSIVSEIARTSRSKAEELINNERVSINCKYEYKTSKQVNVGDIVIVRGSGKYILKDLKENQRTKRVTITLMKYI